MTEPANITDLQNWRSGLPVVSVWNVDKTFAWQMQQVRAGRRLLPSIRLHDLDADAMNASNPNLVKALDAFADDLQFISDNHLPLTLRCDNICDSFTRSPRWLAAPKDRSPLMWNGDVLYGDKQGKRYCSSYASPELWAEEGRLWGGSPYVQKLKSLCDPGSLILVENNEGKYQPSDGPDSFAREKAQYGALYAAFLKASGWACPMHTAAYRGLESNTPGLGSEYVERYGTYNPSGVMYDATSPDVYIQGVMADLASPIHCEVSNYLTNWECEAKSKPGLWREVSVHLESGPASTITPAMWQAYCTTLLWWFRREGVCLRHWDGAATKPTAALGNATVGDYILAELAAVDSILDNPTIREFWEHGQTIIPSGPHPWDARQKKAGLDPYPTVKTWLDVSCNDPVEQMVWSTDQKTYVVITGGTKAKPTTRLARMPVWANAVGLDGEIMLFVRATENVGPVTIDVPGADKVNVTLSQGAKYLRLRKAGWVVEEI